MNEGTDWLKLDNRRYNVLLASYKIKSELLVQLQRSRALMREMYSRYYVLAGKGEPKWMADFRKHFKAADAAIKRAEGGQ